VICDMIPRSGLITVACRSGTLPTVVSSRTTAPWSLHTLPHKSLARTRLGSGKASTQLFHVSHMGTEAEADSS